MSEWLARNVSWHGETSRAEYRRWLIIIIPAELFLLTAIWIYGRRGMVIFPVSWAGFAAFVPCALYVAGLLCLTARRFRSAGLSRGWLLLPFFNINLSVGSYYWNLSATIMLLIIFVAATVSDVPKERRVY
ncbi:MAG: hypothetical protein JHD35_13560 [Sphingopyxis sp.]|nr:hypothetical protein [Sphingopyxis sp.]